MFISSVRGVEIGNNVTLSRGVTILTVALETKCYGLNADKQFRDHIYKSVTIGDGVWVGANATICPGAVIPSKCVIGAGAVVTGVLPYENCLYGGVPAKKSKA